MATRILNNQNNEDLALLSTESKYVTTPFDKSVTATITLMVDLFNSMPGIAGIAAPQVGINKRIMLCSYTRQANDIDILINPSYTPVTHETSLDWEGCLSVPLCFAKVKRFKHIEVTYLDPLGNKLNKKLNNFAARVFQHEYNHLEGNLIIETADEIKTFGNRVDYQVFLQNLRTRNKTEAENGTN